MSYRNVLSGARVFRHCVTAAFAYLSGSSHGVTWVACMCLAMASGRVDVYTQG